MKTIPTSNAAWAHWEIVHFAHTRLLQFWKYTSEDTLLHIP